MLPLLCAGTLYTTSGGVPCVNTQWGKTHLPVGVVTSAAACMLVVLQLEEAMGQQLDDHIVMLQSMGFSPYKKPFEDRLAKWDTMLNLVRTGNLRRICRTNR
jgi:hypothetical protein